MTTAKELIEIVVSENGTVYLGFDIQLARDLYNGLCDNFKDNTVTMFCGGQIETEYNSPKD